MVNENMSLDEIRQKIDEIDNNIQKLIVQRAQYAVKVGESKKTQDDPEYYRPAREAQVLEKIMARHCGDLKPQQMAMIFREIMSACLALQKPMHIACLGPSGTFSELATLKQFGMASKVSYQNSIPEIFYEVEYKHVDFGLVPIENTIGGLVNITLDQFIESSVKICGEVKIEIKQCILQNKANQGDIKRIYSHDQSLAQCNKYISKNYPSAKLIACDSNALAAQQCLKDDESLCIGSSRLADIYGLNLLAEGIEDNTNNVTRFLVIGHKACTKSGDDKTSLLITVQDAPGSLGKLITPIAQNNLNMTMIKSQEAVDRKDKYYFFIDIKAHVDDANLQRALTQLNSEPMLVQVLGSFPNARI